MVEQNNLHLVDKAINRTCSTVKRIDRICCGARYISRILIGIAVIILFDSAVPLPVYARLIISTCLVIFLVYTLGQYVYEFISNRGNINELRYARLLELNYKIKNNVLVNGLLLKKFAVSSPATGNSPRLTTELANRAVNQCVQAVANITANEINPVQTHIDKQPARKALTQLLIIVVLLSLLFGAVSPRLLIMGVPRFIDPFGDHPPFTLLNFDIQTSPLISDILVGDDVDITVTISGISSSTGVDNVELVREVIPNNAHNINSQLPPMKMEQVQNNQLQYQTKLRNLRSPVKVYINTSQGRSIQITIYPVAIPRFTTAQVKVYSPEYALDFEPAIINDPARYTFEVYAGGKIEVTLGSTIPLTNLRIEGDEDNSYWTVQSDAIADISPEISAIFTAPIDIDDVDIFKDYNYQLYGLSETGITTRQPFRLAFKVKPDAPPEIAFTEPAHDAAAMATQEIKTRIIASDDLGITSAKIYVAVVYAENSENDTGHGSIKINPVELALTQSETNSKNYPLQASWTHSIKLSDLKVKPGDVVRYYAEVYDNRRFVNQDEYQFARTDVYEIMIIDNEMYSKVIEEILNKQDPGNGDNQQQNTDKQTPDTNADSQHQKSEPVALAQADDENAADTTSSTVTDTEIESPSDDETATADNENKDDDNDKNTIEDEQALAKQLAENRAIYSPTGQMLTNPADLKSGITQPGVVQGDDHEVDTLNDLDFPGYADNQYMEIIDQMNNAENKTQQLSLSSSLKMLHNVPIAYRSLAERYFRRIAEDEMKVIDN